MLSDTYAAVYLVNYVMYNTVYCGALHLLKQLGMFDIMWGQH